MLKKGISFFIFLILSTAITGCGIYSFTGADIDYSKTKSFQVNYFQNNAAIVEPGMAREFTQQLQDLLLNQTSLDLVNSGGDLTYEGEITEYYIAPITGYNDALKLTAAHTTNRDILFEFITSESFEQDYISLQILSNDQAIGQYDIEIGEDLSQTIDTEQKQEHKQALEDAEAVLDPNLFEKKIADIEQMIAVSQEFSNKEDASDSATSEC